MKKARIQEDSAIYGDGQLLKLDQDGKETPEIKTVMPIIEVPQEDEREKTNYSEK